jgi:enamine deaminase RidA (YjgF/YER057c/UK114 family)
MSYRHIDPEALGPPRGWTNGMLSPVGGRVLFVAGQDAVGPDGAMASDDFTEQFAAALAKSMSVVAEAGGSAPAIGRMTIYVTEIETYRARRAEIGQVYRERMGSHFPAMSLVEVTRLVHPRAKVEIEVTAIITDGGA